MTNPAEAFYAAIRATPDDDLPRLVFADWLDENGQPERAEYIRLACAISHEREGEQRRQWQLQADELFKQNRERWFGQLPKLLSPSFTPSLKYDRGFITDISISAAVLNEHAHHLHRFAPVLRRATISTVGEMAGDVLNLEPIHWVRSLCMRGVTPASLDHLTAHVVLPVLDQLTLTIRECRSDIEADRFLHWSLATTVPSLSLGIEFEATRSGPTWGTDVSDEHTARLIRRVRLPNLKAIVLCRVGRQTGDALSENPALRQITELIFLSSNSRIDSVFRSQYLAELRHLIFYSTPLDDSAIAAIVSCPLLTKLETLGMAGSRLTDQGVYTLIGSDYLPTDLRLIVSDNPFSSRAAARLRERFPNVRF